MTKTIALDLSKKSTGWACWQDGWDRPQYGSVQLGSEYTTDGRTCIKLHTVLAELRQTICKFEAIYFEKPLTQLQRGGNSNASNDIQVKLVGHAESFGEAMSGVRIIQGIDLASWRRHFIGSMKRGTKTKDLKDYTIERCQQFGWRPRNSDEADALGILDYALDLQGVLAPWRNSNPMLPTLGGRT